MKSEKTQNSYKSILKGTSFLGGVQIFQILINALRGKFVALFLGASGMGISALFAAPAATIQKFASLGLNLAIVKEIASAKENEEKLKALVVTVRKLILTTALFGFLLTFLLSGWLSEASFSDRSHTREFMALSLMIFLTIAGNGEMSVLQGLHEVKTLSKAAIIGSLTGLVGGVPLYYFFRDDGIVPAMILLSLTTFLFYFYSVRKKIATAGVTFKWKEHRPLIRQLLTIGFILMASDLIGSGCTYILNIVVRAIDNLESVGLYQAANSLTNQYSSLVFAAMAMDYLPRLTAVADNNSRLTDIVNKQSEIVAFIIAPIVTLLLLFAPIIIKILYTEEFLLATELLRWMSLAILVKALSYPMGYITFAKDNKTLFFWLEGVVCNLQTMILSIIGFYFFGLDGLGYGLLADSILCFILYYFVNKKLYQYTLSKQVMKCFSFALLLPVCAYIPIIFIDHTYIAYTLTAFITAVTIFISYRQLRLLWHKDK